MNTSQTPRKTTRIMALVVLIVIITVAFLAWAQRGLAECDPPVISPGGSYRVDVCTPVFSTFMLHGSMPRYVKFYDQKRQRSLGQSDIIDLSGRGQTVWPTADNLSITVGLGDDAPSVRVSAPDGQ